MNQTKQANNRQRDEGVDRMRYWAMYTNLVGSLLSALPQYLGAPQQIFQNESFLIIVEVQLVILRTQLVIMAMQKIIAIYFNFIFTHSGM